MSNPAPVATKRSKLNPFGNGPRFSTVTVTPMAARVTRTTILSSFDPARAWLMAFTKRRGD